MYSLIRRAKYLGVAPWELLERIERGEEIWYRWAALAEAAEVEATIEKRARHDGANSH